MERLKISPNETIYYEYDPETDRLAIRLEPSSPETEEEPVAALPHLALSRDARSGAVVGVTVTSVQALLLERLVRDIFFQTLPLVEAARSSAPEAPVARAEGAEAPAATESFPDYATAMGEGVPETAEAPIAREEERAEAPAAAESFPDYAMAMGEGVPEAAEAPAPAEAEGAPELPPAAASQEEAPASEEPEARAPRKRRRSRKKAEPEADEAPSPEPAPEPVEEAPLLEAPVEAEPEKPARRRSRKKAEPEPEPEPVAETPVPEPAPEKPARQRNRKKAETEAVEAPGPVKETPLPEAGAGEAPGKPARKRRRRKRRKQEDEPAGPVAEEGESEAEDEGEDEAGGQPWREALGRPEPIPGLGAPEAFEFMGMHPYLGQVLSVMGFEEPTPIQRRAVPPLMEGRDVIGLSQTGTGKTFAFLIPALHRLLQDETTHGHQPRVLVLAPTRELVVQVADAAEMLATYTNLRVTTIYGGVSMSQQIRALKRGVDVIVATPGRLLDHIRRNNVKLDQVQVAVLDEADRMLDMGFLPDIRSIIGQLPRKRQTLLFSATMPPPIESLSLDFQRDPLLIEVARRVPPESIEQVLYPVERHLKTPLLVHLLKQDEQMSRVLVFAETKAESDILARKLQEAGISVDLMHGDRSQVERERALQRLRDNRVRVLVATNVASRGLDVEGISHIVNYDIPESVDDYIHRIGRTARGEAEGKAITFVSFSDEGMVKRIESALERELPRVRAEGFDYDVTVPSWAKPSADDIIDRLTQPQGLADRFRQMMGRRR